MGISAVVITYNEEANIERCLNSLSFADEIVIVDSFSNDRTLEIASRYTQNITQREFTGFSDQKNAAIALATNEWVVIIDADEVVTKELGGEIRYAIENGDKDAYRIPRLTNFLGRPIYHCGWYPDYQLRVVRRSKAYIPNRLVHETLEVDGPCGTLKNDLIHYSYECLDDYTRKMIPYARAAAEQKLRDGRKFRIGDILFAPALTFFKMYILKQGFRDGLYGFIVCGLSACSILFRYSMLWEMSIRRAGSKEQNTDE